MGTASSTRSSSTRDESFALLEEEMAALARRMRRVIAERARSVHPGLQGSSFLMLALLHQRGPQRASAMTEAFGIDKGAISRQIQHLLDLGLVHRTPDPYDGRATLISVSPEAERRMEQMRRDRRRRLEDRLGDWTEDDIASFAAMLARYNRSFGERSARDGAVDDPDR